MLALFVHPITGQQGQPTPVTTCLDPAPRSQTTPYLVRIVSTRSLTPNHHRLDCKPGKPAHLPTQGSGPESTSSLRIESEIDLHFAFPTVTPRCFSSLAEGVTIDQRRPHDDVTTGSAICKAHGKMPPAVHGYAVPRGLNSSKAALQHWHPSSSLVNAIYPSSSAKHPASDNALQHSIRLSHIHMLMCSNAGP